MFSFLRNLLGPAPVQGSAPAAAVAPALTVAGMHVVITSQHLVRLGVSPDRAATWGPLMASVLPEYGISTRPRVAAFLANGLHETGMLSVLSESMDYSPERLMAVFSRSRISAEQCQALGRLPGRPADQRAIANIVYGGAFGRAQLGNTQPNDGWDMRGGGFFQTTGRSNFTRVGERQNMTAEQACAFVRTPEGALRSAAIFFTTTGCQAHADAGDIVSCRHVVSGGASIGIDEVQAIYAHALQVLA